MRLERLIAIRLVSHDAEALAGFYVTALGFECGATVPIATEELALLGMRGGGSRTSLVLDPRPSGEVAARSADGGGRFGDHAPGRSPSVSLREPPPPKGEDLSGLAVLEIDQFDPPGQLYPQPRASDDRLFQHFAMVTTDVSEVWARVRTAGGQAISAEGPVQLPPENGSVEAVKFRDPEGHPLELLAFPNPAQHSLAIDHSAIVVRDVAASIAFYRTCGLAVGARTLNHGAAQAALDGLAHPNVDVVPLNPRGAGPHLELLGYRDPVSRSETPWNPRDVAATRLVWEAAEAALIIDPDGHLHQCQPRGTPRASR